MSSTRRIGSMHSMWVGREVGMDTSQSASRCLSSAEKGLATPGRFFRRLTSSRSAAAVEPVTSAEVPGLGVAFIGELLTSPRYPSGLRQGNGGTEPAAARRGRWPELLHDTSDSG